VLFITDTKASEITATLSSLMEPSKPLTTTATAKPIYPTRKEKPPIATLHTKSDVVTNLQLSLTQAGMGSSNQSDDDLNQLIDFIVGSKLFSYSEIAYLCLTPQQERTEMLMAILAKIKESKGLCHVCTELTVLYNLACNFRHSVCCMYYSGM